MCTVTALSNYGKKQGPLIINYRHYNKFNEDEVREDLRRQLEILDVDTMTIDQFDLIFKTILSWYAPVKKKVIRENSAPFMNKTLSKAFMHRSRLKKKLIKSYS